MNLYTLVTMTTAGYSVHNIFSKEIAEKMFDMAVAHSGTDIFMEAIFLYGPEGQINNWVRDRE